MRDAHLWKKTRDEEDAEDDLYTYEEPPVEVQLDTASGVLQKQRVSYDEEDDEPEALGNLVVERLISRNFCCYKN